MKRDISKIKEKVLNKISNKITQSEKRTARLKTAHNCISKATTRQEMQSCRKK